MRFPTVLRGYEGTLVSRELSVPELSLLDVELYIMIIAMSPIISKDKGNENIPK